MTRIGQRENKPATTASKHPDSTWSSRDETGRKAGRHIRGVTILQRNSPSVSSALKFHERSIVARIYGPFISGDAEGKREPRRGSGIARGEGRETGRR